MHLCFIDESGTPAKPGAKKPRYFVLAGLIIPEERWHRIADRLRGLKTRFGYFGEIKWRYFAPNNNDAGNPMADWSFERRNDLRTQAVAIIAAEQSVKIIAGLCDCVLAYEKANVNTQNDIYYQTYKVVTERFQYYLQDVRKSNGTPARGIIVADHRGHDDDRRLRIQHQRLVEEDAVNTASYKDMVEGLFLAPSHMSVGIQLADLVAGAIWRRFDANDSHWFDRIAPSIRTGPSGKIDGYGIARVPHRGWTLSI